MAGAAPVVRVEGARELRRTLKKAGDDLADLRDLHRQVAGVIVPVATAGAPHLTGRLAGSLRTGATKTQAIVRAGSAAVPYAGVQEWGWPRRRIRPQPFVVPAAHETEPRWTGIYLDGVQAIVDKVKGV